MPHEQDARPPSPGVTHAPQGPSAPALGPGDDRHTARARTLAQICRVVGAFFTVFMTWGVASSFSAYQAYYQEHLLSTYAPSTIAWIGTSQVCLLGVTGALSGALFDRGYMRPMLLAGAVLVVLGFFMLSLSHAYYQIILAQGLCIGIGDGLLFVPSIAVISTTFESRRAIAIGIASSGSAVGGIVLPILFRHLQPTLGFGWVNRVFGFIMLTLATVALPLLRPDPRRVRPRGPLFDPSAMKEAPYLASFVGLFFVFLGYWVPLIFIVPYAQLSLRTDRAYAFYLLAIMNAGSFFGRILPAFAAQVLGPALVLAGGGLSLGILILAWIGIHNVAGITVWAFLVGFMAGITVAIPAAVVPLMSPSPTVIGARTGMLWTGSALAALIGSPIAGALIDTATNNYTYGEVFGGATTVFGGLLLMYPVYSLAKTHPPKRAVASETPVSLDQVTGSADKAVA